MDILFMYELETGNIVAASDDAFIDKFLATQTKVLVHDVELTNEETGDTITIQAPVFSDSGSVEVLEELDTTKFDYLVITTDTVQDFANRDMEDFVVKVAPIFYGTPLTQIDAFRGLERKIALQPTTDNRFVEAVVMRKMIQDEAQLAKIVGEFEFPKEPKGGYHNHYMTNYVVQNGALVEKPTPEAAA